MVAFNDKGYWIFGSSADGISELLSTPHYTMTFSPLGRWPWFLLLKNKNHLAPAILPSSSKGFLATIHFVKVLSQPKEQKAFFRCKTSPRVPGIILLLSRVTLPHCTLVLPVWGWTGPDLTTFTWPLRSCHTAQTNLVPPLGPRISLIISVIHTPLFSLSLSPSLFF